MRDQSEFPRLWLLHNHVFRRGVSPELLLIDETRNSDGQPSFSDDYYIHSYNIMNSLNIFSSITAEKRFYTS